MKDFSILSVLLSTLSTTITSTRAQFIDIPNNTSRPLSYGMILIPNFQALGT